MPVFLHTSSSCVVLVLGRLSLDEVCPAGGYREGDQGDQDADKLGGLHMTSAQDDVDLQNQLGSRLLNIKILSFSILYG